MALRYKAPAAGDDVDDRPDCIAVRLASDQAKSQKSSACGLVMQVGERLVVRQDQHVHPAVIVEIADRQAARHSHDTPGTAGTVGDIGQTAVRSAAQRAALASRKDNWAEGH